MSADVHLYRAIAYVERALSIGYAPTYSLHQAADVYQIPPGQLAELLLVKRIECDRARIERDALLAHDAEIDRGPARPSRGTR